MTDTTAAEAVEAVPPAPPEATSTPAPEAEPENDDTRTARQKVLDHLTDSEGPQSVSEIIQGTGLSRNTCEQAIFRAVQSEQIERVSQGVYRLAPPKPLPPSRDGHTNEEWIARILAWQVNPESWNIEEDGPPPNDPNHRIPLDVVGRFKDRQAREAKKREKREGAAARQAAADAELRDKLVAATHGNFTPGPGLDDVSPIRAAMELIPLDTILTAIRFKTDKKLYPGNEPATTWRESRLLKAVAEHYCRFTIVPSMVDAWSKATAKAPGKPADASKASPAAQVAPKPADASEPSSEQPVAVPNGESSRTAKAPDGRSRESIIAAFNQNRTPPQPMAQRPPPAQANLLNTTSPRSALPDSGRPRRKCGPTKSPE